jgi:geranylgeranyl pyrophosphate synthase
MGIAFQMIDDILDVVGHADLLGKPIGMDLRDGNPSLPILLALKDNNVVVREVFDCTNPSERQVDAALDAIKSGHAIQEAKSISKCYAEKALKSIKKLPPSIYRNGLKTMVQLIIDRDF